MQEKYVLMGIRGIIPEDYSFRGDTDSGPTLCCIPLPLAICPDLLICNLWWLIYSDLRFSLLSKILMSWGLLYIDVLVTLTYINIFSGVLTAGIPRPIILFPAPSNIL